MVAGRRSLGLKWQSIEIDMDTMRATSLTMLLMAFTFCRAAEPPKGSGSSTRPWRLSQVFSGPMRVFTLDLP